jgi:hypothetical protein
MGSQLPLDRAEATPAALPTALQTLYDQMHQNWASAGQFTAVVCVAEAVKQYKACHEGPQGLECSGRGCHLRQGGYYIRSNSTWNMMTCYTYCEHWKSACQNRSVAVEGICWRRSACQHVRLLSQVSSPRLYPWSASLAWAASPAQTLCYWDAHHGTVTAAQTQSCERRCINNGCKHWPQCTYIETVMQVANDVDGHVPHVLVLYALAGVCQCLLGDTASAGAIVWLFQKHCSIIHGHGYTWAFNIPP